MDIPERSLDAASEEIRKILGGRQYASTIGLTDIPRILEAAFAVVPDPVSLAERWEKVNADLDSIGSVGMGMRNAAAELRAFMKGNQK